jgi:4-alpha-glucanotransferase
VSLKRSSGILLHITSLPGKFGIGDLGHEALEFISFLATSGQSLWQVLPLGPTGYGDSPYQSLSAFAGNTLLISPACLLEIGLLEPADLERAPQFPEDRVDFGKVISYKRELLKRAFDRFERAPDRRLREDFKEFCQSETWLEAYALFRALKDAHGGAAWNLWEPELAGRDQKALASARNELSREIQAEKFYQYLFFKQWHELKEHAHKHGVKIIGDMPIFVAADSADVWENRELFKLDQRGNPRVVAGVPPDYFSKTGQRWGNPIYDWDRMRQDGFHWWIERMRAALRMFDLIRIDHFRGFAACWEIPASDQTAERGQWVQAPGRELFSTLKRELGELPIIAEDLGVITPDAVALRDEFGFPGMRILQFAFDGDSSNQNLPHNYVPNCAVYTGTHDNDTTVGWFRSSPGEGSTRDAKQIERERSYCLKYLNTDGSQIHWDFIRAAMASVARIAIVPLQDVLGLDSSARMNLPGRRHGNWTWRFRADMLTPDMNNRLGELAEIYGRK